MAIYIGGVKQNNFEVGGTEIKNMYVGGVKVYEKAPEYDIPAGTYTPSAFKSLMSNFIATISGSYRLNKNSFSATVNYRTYNAVANTNIIYHKGLCSGSGSSTLEKYVLSGNNRDVAGIVKFEAYGNYIVGYTKGNDSKHTFNSFGGAYGYYPITISDGIKFV